MQVGVRSCLNAKEGCNGIPGSGARLPNLTCTGSWNRDSFTIVGLIWNAYLHLRRTPLELHPLPCLCESFQAIDRGRFSDCTSRYTHRRGTGGSEDSLTLSHSRRPFAYRLPSETLLPHPHGRAKTSFPDQYSRAFASEESPLSSISPLHSLGITIIV